MPTGSGEAALASLARLARLVGLVAPDAEAVAAYSWVPELGRAGVAEPPWERLAAALVQGDATLAAFAAALDPALTLGHREAGLGFTGEAVAAATRAFAADLLVVAAGPDGPARPAASWVARSARALGVDVLWVTDRAVIPTGPAASHLLCPFERSLAPLGPMARFLSQHDRPDGRVTFLGLSDARRGAVPRPSALTEVAGLQAEISISFARDRPLASTLDLLREEAERLDAGFICFPFAATSGLVQAAAALVAPQILAAALRPVLFVAGEPAVGKFGAVTNLDAADVAATFDRVLRIHAVCLGPLDLVMGNPGEAVVLIAGGAVLARAEISGGDVSLSIPLDAAEGFDALGLSRGDDPRAVEHLIRIVRPDQRAVLLVHADLPAALLARVAALAPVESRRLLAVRLRPSVACREYAARFAAAGLTHVRLLDASAVLDSGDAAEAPDSADSAHLLRVARHLRASGFAVDAVVGPGARALQPPGIAWFAEADLAGLADAELLATIARLGTAPASVGAIGSDAAVMDELTSALPSAGNAVTIEVDNAHGRRLLMEVVASAERWVHLQVYIVHDDPLTREIEEALRLATARGVQVRVLVDSLYSLHGSFGVENALLARLGALPGVKVLASGRIDTVPDLEALKQRDHRKILSVDGTTAIVTGRNLAASYYRGFDELALSPTTAPDDVPWLDAGAVVRGPAVAEIDEAFAVAWRAAGGLAWRGIEPAPAGQTAVRIVIHRGLADTRTLDAYVTLIRQARHHLTVVNGFPLADSLSRALLAAQARGVRVRILSGHFRPLRGDGTPFPGVAPLHELADQVAHGRIDRLVEGGIEAYSLVVEPGADWLPEVGVLKPHVHAKLLSADGRVCTVGSANLDVTAGYWEDEVLAIIDDPEVTATLDLALDRIISRSERADPADPAWKARSARRAWLSRNWPSLLQ
ncbi:MAG: phosphatidylserine/phosphatidylglycerophosphate/cardiolipin synthase family protein [Myxococcota bacterium]